MNTLYKSTLFFSISAIFIATNISADTIHISLPKVIKAPEVNVKVVSPVTVETNDKSDVDVIGNKKSMNKPVGFSKRVPPSYGNDEVAQNHIQNASKVSTFLELPMLPIETLKKNLEQNGFYILSEYRVDKKGSVVSIVFTSPLMTSNASKTNRGFASTLRALVNKNSGVMSITNPLYVMKAFMQEDYDAEVVQKTLSALNNSFKGLKSSKDVVKFSKLDHYRFMDNMPYYHDMETVACGENEKLLETARKSKKIVYEHTLKNGSVVIGVSLSKRTSKFVKKIGYQNAGLLPYPILIEQNEAKILSPQYYIAIMYPMLNMTKFMSIASVPGAIVKDCGKVFR